MRFSERKAIGEGKINVVSEEMVSVYAKCFQYEFLCGALGGIYEILEFLILTKTIGTSVKICTKKL